MQLFSVDQQRSQALEGHAASFASFRVPGNDKDSLLISFATKTSNAGQITSKLHVIELGAQPGKSSFTKKQANLFFPPDFVDDFPVAIQISHKYSLIYVITKLGLLFIYDLETATAVYKNRISSDPIFLTSEASSVGGFYAINRRGQVLLATVNETTIIPFISGQLNNLKLPVNLARRENLPGCPALARIVRPDENANDAASEYAWESAPPPGTTLMMLDPDKMVAAAASSWNPTLVVALTRPQRCASSSSWELHRISIAVLSIMHGQVGHGVWEVEAHCCLQVVCLEVGLNKPCRMDRIC